MAGAAALWWSWGTWPDVLIDFGRELYVPWQLAQGRVLYADIAYLTGPLSPYVNSLWFRMFGPGLLTLVACNVVILAVLIGMFYRLLAAVAGLFPATVACLALIAMFAFGQTMEVGNYNFVCPYAHELTHGLALSVAGICLLSVYHRRRGAWWAAGAGLAVGLVFLTKMEVFLAAALAVTAGLGLTIRAQGVTSRRALSILGLYAAAMVLPPLIAFALLGRVMPAEQALRGTLGSWWTVSNSELTSLSFYRRGMGMSNPLANLKVMFMCAGWYAGVFVPPAVFALLAGRGGVPRRLIRLLAPAWVVGVLVAASGQIRWDYVARPFPLFMLAVAGAALLLHLRRPADADGQHRHIVVIVLGVFAFVLLGKIVLNARVFHYGFALALPAALLLLVSLVGWIPSGIGRSGGEGWVFQAAALAAVSMTAGVHLQRSNVWFNTKTITVAAGVDAFRSDERGGVVRQALGEIAELLDPPDTLAVLPEGVMINYLARRVNPTPYINLMPPEMIVFGEDAVLASFRAHPPDCIALVHKDTSEYGPRFFGRDYGRRIHDWVQGNYQQVALVGAPPFQDERFGISLLALRGDGGGVGGGPHRADSGSRAKQKWPTAMVD